MSINSNIVRSQLIEAKFYENSRHTDNIPLINEESINNKMVNSSIISHPIQQEIIPAQEVYTSGNYVSSERKTLTQTTEGHRQVLNNNAPCFIHSEAVDRETASMAESMLTDALLPPSAIHLKDIIGSTLDKKELMFIREKLTDKYSAMENPIIQTLPKSSQSLATSDVSHIHSAKEYNSTNIKDTGKIVAKSPERNLSLSEKTEVSNAINFFFIFNFISVSNIYKHLAKMVAHDQCLQFNNNCLLILSMFDFKCLIFFNSNLKIILIVCIIKTIIKIF
jgi:hypothetical protein